MSDDIVTQLRQWQKPIVTQDDILDLRQAVDEIERLRATNKRLRDDYSYEIWGEPADD